MWCGVGSKVVCCAFGVWECQHECLLVYLVVRCCVLRVVVCAITFVQLV